MREFSSARGRQMFQLLPAVYRERDNAVRDADGRVQEIGDLARYLDALGGLLDRVYATIEQRHRDSDPATRQTWLLPYVARMVDARPLSPDIDGRSAEVQRAVDWRQRKGTRACVEEIAETVGRMDVELQEGWMRVAVTPRIGAPLLPAKALGADREPDAKDPLEAIRHPGLTAITPDLRSASRSEQARPENPVARITAFSGQPIRWRQANPFGAPCFPGSYEDVSRRTPDLRAPAWDRGHHHPATLLVYAPPPDGFFSPQAPSIEWSERYDHPDLLKRTDEWRSDGGAGGVRVRSFICGLEGNQILRINGVISLGGDVMDRDDDIYRFEGVHLADTVTVHKGVLELVRCAAEKVVVHKAGTAAPALRAENCLFKKVQAASGLARLEYCTVMESTVCEALQASDCIFMDRIRKGLQGDAPPGSGCVRFSRVAPDQAPIGEPRFSATVTSESPLFFSGDWGEAGCGVLHPAAPEAICAGAEDRGEMGAFHHQHHCLRREAVRAKLRDYLPLGIEPVLIPDARLACVPPK